MNWTPTIRTIDLGYDQLLTFEGRPGTRVRVLYGSMWLTEEGDPRDVFVHCGDEVTLSSDGRSVIEGLGAARVQVIDRKRSSPWPAVGRRAAHVWELVKARRPRDILARSVLMGLAIVVSIAVLHVAVPGPLVRLDSTLVAQGPSASEGVLADLASAKTSFLAVN